MTSRPYLRRKKRWLIEVTHDSEYVETYGPFFEEHDARAFMESRVTTAGADPDRSRDILAIRLIQTKRGADRRWDDLVGVRFVVV